ncbi:unnamed protein product [Dicrocoelium dendriticum]|nr:unnamed protein product [Dicrocoelium dendriticum]
MPFLPFTSLLPHIVRPRFVVVNTELMRIARTRHCAVVVVSHDRPIYGFKDAKYPNDPVSETTKQECVKQWPATLSTNSHKRLLLSAISDSQLVTTNEQRKLKISLIQNTGNPGMCRSVSEKHDFCIISI